MTCLSGEAASQPAASEGPIRLADCTPVRRGSGQMLLELARVGRFRAKIGPSAAVFGPRSSAPHFTCRRRIWAVDAGSGQLNLYGPRRVAALSAQRPERSA
jgi:hypothetical protein